jgi:hypothetical protein
LFDPQSLEYPVQPAVAFLEQVHFPSQGKPSLSREIRIASSSLSNPISSAWDDILLQMASLWPPVPTVPST